MKYLLRDGEHYLVRLTKAEFTKLAREQGCTVWRKRSTLRAGIDGCFKDRASFTIERRWEGELGWDEACDGDEVWHTCPTWGRHMYGCTHVLPEGERRWIPASVDSASTLRLARSFEGDRHSPIGHWEYKAVFQPSVHPQLP